MKVSEMNQKQKKAFYNIYHASNWLIGGLENSMSDYSEDSEEYINAKNLLENHEALVDELYSMSISEIYDEGYCCFNDSVCKKYLRDIRFCGKEWLMERCEKRIKKHGY